jgi:hypothetical protein
MGALVAAPVRDAQRQCWEKVWKGSIFIGDAIGKPAGKTRRNCRQWR